MVTRICISINNSCNLRCGYCHFHEKEACIQEANMDVFQILDAVTAYITKHNIPLFKIGFVGNGEPLLAYEALQAYILYIDTFLQSGVISAYIITNGLLLNAKKLRFFKAHNVSVGISVDGIQSVHDKWRCGSFDAVMEKIAVYREIYGEYPPMNCTVGKDVLEHTEETISFFAQFQNRVTFSRMIGTHGISMQAFLGFLEEAKKKLNVRTGGYDCTMYGGLCGAGIDNFFYANGKIYLCGNCIDLESSVSSATPLEEIAFAVADFDRTGCYKEAIK